MESEINDFGLVAECFLSDLRKFKNNCNKLNESVRAPLLQLQYEVPDLLKCSKRISGAYNRMAHYQFDGDVFDAKRSIECCWCKKSFPFTRVEFNQHIQSRQHLTKSLEYREEDNFTNVSYGPTAGLKTVDATSVLNKPIESNKSIKEWVNTGYTTNATNRSQESPTARNTNVPRTNEWASNRDVNKQMAVRFEQKREDSFRSELSARNQVHYRNGKESMVTKQNDQIDAFKSEVKQNGFNDVAKSEHKISADKKPMAHRDEDARNGYEKKPTLVSSPKKIDKKPPPDDESPRTRALNVFRDTHVATPYPEEYKHVATKPKWEQESKKTFKPKLSERSQVPYRADKSTVTKRNVFDDIGKPEVKPRALDMIFTDEFIVDSGHQEDARKEYEKKPILVSSSNKIDKKSPPDDESPSARAPNLNVFRETHVPTPFPEEYKHVATKPKWEQENKETFKPELAACNQVPYLANKSTVTKRNVFDDIGKPVLKPRALDMIFANEFTVDPGHHKDARKEYEKKPTLLSSPKKIDKKPDDESSSAHAPNLNVFRETHVPTPFPEEYKRDTSVRKIEPIAGLSNKFAKSSLTIPGLMDVFKDDFMDKLNCVEFNGQSHSTVITSVENLLKTEFKSVECYLLGSRVNETTMDGNAVLDIYVDFDKGFDKQVAIKTIKKHLLEAQNLMNASNGEWSNTKIYLYSGNHILNGTHCSTGIKCKFTVGSGIFVRNNDIITAYFEAQPICRQLVLSIRLSLENLKQSKWTRKFSGHIISLLAIFFFQSTDRLPSIKELQINSETKICGDALVSFDPPKNHVTACSDRLGELLIGFFEFYSKFDFVNNIIALYEGTTISHNDIESDEKSLSKSVLRFKHMIANNASANFNRSVMCTQDLFLFKRNATQSIDEPTIEKFVEYCAHSLQILQSLSSSISY